MDSGLSQLYKILHMRISYNLLFLAKTKLDSGSILCP